MVNEMVHLRLDPKMRSEIKRIVKENTFSNETEFIKESIRSNLEYYRKLAILHSFKNSVPQTRKKIKSSSDIFRDFGIE